MLQRSQGGQKVHIFQYFEHSWYKCNFGLFPDLDIQYTTGLVDSIEQQQTTAIHLWFQSLKITMVSSA